MYYNLVMIFSFIYSLTPSDVTFNLCRIMKRLTHFIVGDCGGPAAPIITFSEFKLQWTAGDNTWMDHIKIHIYVCIYKWIMYCRCTTYHSHEVKRLLIAPLIQSFSLSSGLPPLQWMAMQVPSQCRFASWSLSSQYRAEPVPPTAAEIFHCSRDLKNTHSTIRLHFYKMRSVMICR